MAVDRFTLFGRTAAAVLWLGAMALPASAQDVDPLGIPDTQLEPVQWSNLDGWAADDQAAAFATFRASCRPFLARYRTPDNRPVAVALREVCKRAAAAGDLGGNKDRARAFFEDNFRPVRIARLGESTGLLTSYYEPVVDGSRFPNPEFHTPIYRRPRDLVIADDRSGNKSKAGRTGSAKVAPKASPPKAALKPAQASQAFPNRATVGRLIGKKLEPYYDRGAIEAGALDGKKLEICWIREPFDVMTLQIQGSARVKLEDGTTLRINYDAHNGHSYTAVGRVLIERNLVPRDEMSMGRIRQWMHDNPDQAQEVRQTNRSYVFFRITGLSDDGEPNGAQGIPLTPGRSIAVDKTHVYGTPFFIEAELPIESARPTTKFRRLMVAQDTGSAITGPARADIYWGSGNEAGRIAGRIRQQGRFVILLPRELDMIEAGKQMPLPAPKPVIPDEKNQKKKDDKAKDAGQAEQAQPAAPAQKPATPAAPGAPAAQPKAKAVPRRSS